MFGSDDGASDQSEAAISRRRGELAAKVRMTVEREPLFQVRTLDGLKWICPYTGTQVEATFGHVEPAVKHLLQTQPWRKGNLHTLPELNHLRWRLYLTEHLRDDRRLRHFQAGRWLNPCTGDWLPLPNFTGRVNPGVIDMLAAALAANPTASLATMKPPEALERIAAADAEAKNADEIELSRSHGHTRTSDDNPRDKAPARISTTDLDLAGGILSKILSPMPHIPDWRFAAHYEPHTQVGGDLYEVQQLSDGRWFFAVADVTGHGVQGAMVVIAAVKSLRFVLRHECNLVEILSRLGTELKGDLLDGQFITCFAGIIDPELRRVECVCAGHHQALLLRHSGPVMLERVGQNGPAIGLVPSSVLKAALRPVTIEMRPGDLLLQYTDGYIEAMNVANEEFGETRLAGALLRHAEGPFNNLLPGIAKAARRHALGILADDATLFAIMAEPPPAE